MRCNHFRVQSIAKGLGRRHDGESAVTAILRTGRARAHEADTTRDQSSRRSRTGAQSHSLIIVRARGPIRTVRGPEAEITVRQVPHGEGVVNVVDVRHGQFAHHQARSFSVEFHHPNAEILGSCPLLDGYVLGLLPLCMQGADRLVVRGPVSNAVVRNAWTLGEAWHAWVPHQYRPVEVVADEMWDDSQLLARRETPIPDAAIAAFSGGVDSTFTAMRHATGSLGSASYPVADVCMVHGFDVRLDNSVDFDGLLTRTKPFVDYLGVRLHVVRTNLREATQPDWERAFALYLACVLHQFSGSFTTGLIASGDLDFLRPPVNWGSTPATDPLMSGAAFQMVHDGAGYSRSEKIEFLSGCTEARMSLKFCYQGEREDRNCGRCFKCVRTYLSFLALGFENPECFSGPITAAEVASITPFSARTLEDLKGVLSFARSVNSTNVLFDVLANRLDNLTHPRSSQISVPVVSSSTSELTRRLAHYRHSLGTWLRSMRHIRLLSAMRGNVGDHLIWKGTETLLHMEGINFDCMSLDDLEAMSDTPIGGTLVIPGSGAFTTLWHEWLPQFVSSASRLFEQVVILPSEYHPDVSIVHEALTRPNVYAFARDPVSYQRIRPYGRAVLALDPALYAFDVSIGDCSPRPDHDLGHVLVALRTDAGSQLGKSGLSPDAANDDISVSRADLAEFLYAIEAVDSVVTDRLHVAVAAIMLGKTLRFVDPYEQKISRYAAFAFRSEFDATIGQRDETWLVSHGFAFVDQGVP